MIPDDRYFHDRAVQLFFALFPVPALAFANMFRPPEAKVIFAVLALGVGMFSMVMIHLVRSHPPSPVPPPDPTVPGWDVDGATWRRFWWAELRAEALREGARMWPALLGGALVAIPLWSGSGRGRLWGAVSFFAIVYVLSVLSGVRLALAPGRRVQLHEGALYVGGVAHRLPRSPRGLVAEVIPGPGPATLLLTTTGANPRQTPPVRVPVPADRIADAEALAAALTARVGSAG